MSQGVAVVTGGARGIGRAVVTRLVALDWPVLAVDVDADGLDEVRGDVGASVTPLVADVGADRTQDLVRDAAHALGPIAVLVNNAAVSPKRDGIAVPTVELTTDEWEAVLRVNLTGAFRLCQVAATDMAKLRWGRIVNVSSLAARTGTRVPGSHYVASKSALLGFSRTLALELAPNGITVNCIAPGRIDTPMGAQATAAINDKLRNRVPVGRFGRPEDIAAAVAFLVGDDAEYITGATFDVNGGMLMI